MHDCRRARRRFQATFSSISSPTPPTDGYFNSEEDARFQTEGWVFVPPYTRPGHLFTPTPHRGRGGASTAGRTPTEVSLRRTQGLPAPIKLVPFIHKPSRFFPSRVWPRPRAHRDNGRARRSGDASLPVSTGELTNMWTPLPNH